MFREAFEFYKNVIKPPAARLEQARCVVDSLKDYPFGDHVEVIETGASHDINDGCFGLFLGYAANKMYSVDINKENIENSKKTYYEFLPELDISHHIGDSAMFLKGYSGQATIVHLDSFDLNLKNPIPSMLHGFLEFQELEHKMPIGSYIIIDDNYLKGSWVDWNLLSSGIITETERIDISYDIIGKGSLIYHYCKEDRSNWKIIGDHYKPGKNVKLIIQKIR